MNAPTVLPGEKRQVLVVDDHELSRKHMRAVLSFHGYAVATAESAAQARALMQQQVPHVVLLDLQMPGETGYELLAWMRQQPALQHVPAICVTASVPSSEQERVKLAGFASFVPKPITPPQRLLDALTAALAGAAP